MITQEEFNSLFNENITKKQYDKIISKINYQFSVICNKFLKKSHRNAWFDYGNGDYNSEQESIFDPNEFKEYITIMGEYISPPPGYDFNIPTRWLWEPNWEGEMKQNIINAKKQQIKEKEKRKFNQEKQKEKLKQAKEKIKSKLTSEELKLIKFKG